jgi:hypothetical protein
MTELIWEGKYVDGKRQSPVRVALPSQTIETVNESAAGLGRQIDLEGNPPTATAIYACYEHRVFAKTEAF